MLKRLGSFIAHKLFIWICFVPALLYIVYYEFLLPTSINSVLITKTYIIISKIAYSILAASLFYLISQYIPVLLPKHQKKIKVLRYVFFKTNYINYYIGDLQSKIGINFFQDDYSNLDFIADLLKKINPNSPTREYKNWYLYLYHLKSQLLEMIKSITIYEEYLSKEFLEELLCIENQLITPYYTFIGYKSLASDDLEYAKHDFQEIFVHNKHLQKLKEEEFKKYEKYFKKDGNKYRTTHYQEIDNQKK